MQSSPKPLTCIFLQPRVDVIRLLTADVRRRFGTIWNGILAKYNKLT